MGYKNSMRRCLSFWPKISFLIQLPKDTLPPRTSGSRGDWGTFLRGDLPHKELQQDVTRVWARRPLQRVCHGTLQVSEKKIQRENEKSRVGVWYLWESLQGESGPQATSGGALQESHKQGVSLSGTSLSFSPTRMGYSHTLSHSAEGQVWE